MEIISLHLDISWIILFGEKGMHALLRDVNYWLEVEAVVLEVSL